MIEEAKVYADEDRRQREEVEAGIKADNLIYAAEKIVAQRGARLDGTQLAEMDVKVLAVKAALASGDSTLIKSRTEELQEVVKDLCID